MGDELRSTNGHSVSGRNSVSGAALSTGKFSLTLGTANKKNPALYQHSSAKRPHKSLLGAVEDDANQEQHEQISTFGHGLASDGAAVTTQGQNARIIKRIPDKDWREESLRKKQRQPDTYPRGFAPNARTSGIAVEGSVPKFGLNVVERTSRSVNDNGLQDSAQGPLPASGIVDGAAKVEQSSLRSPPQTADEEALSALLGQHHSTENAVIAPAPPSDDEVFRESYESAPRNCTLEEYEATPVEGYGAAILRGYLKEGQTLEDHYQNGGASKEGSVFMPARRPGLLGLGAKESGLGVELGAWGKGAGASKGRGSRPADASYNPLARRNKKTGEMITEDGLKERLEAQKDIAGNGRERRSRGEGNQARHGGYVNGSRSGKDHPPRELSRDGEQRNNYKEDYDQNRRKERYRGGDGHSDHPHVRRENDADDSDSRRRRKDDARNHHDYDSSRRKRRNEELKDDVGARMRLHRDRSSERAKDSRHSSRW